MDSGNTIAVDGTDIAYVGGETESSNDPTTASALQPTYGGSGDAFLTQVAAGGAALVYSSFLGGSDADVAWGLALDYDGSAYLTGYTSSINSPTSRPFQGYGGGQDAFVTRVSVAPPRPKITAVSSDTGASGGDLVTTDQTLALSGQAQPNSTVTISRADVGTIGSVTAGGSGQWGLDYTGTTLAEGTYAFTATATLNGQTSAPSATFLVTVDRTAPALTLAALASTFDLSPEVRVVASDLGGLPNDTILADYKVFLDVDLNDDGGFTGSELAYTIATLHDGHAVFEVRPSGAQPALQVGSSYRLRARVKDVAGNEGQSPEPYPVVSITAVPTEQRWQTTAQHRAWDPLDGDALLQTGNVRIDHALDLDRSPARSACCAPALVYNSDAVRIRPAIQASVQTDNSGPLPGTLSVQLTWNGVLQSARPIDFPTTGRSPGELLTLALRVANPVTVTGRHTWNVWVIIPGQPDVNVSGSTFVAPQDASPLGAGWTFSLVDRLYDIPDGGMGNPADMLRAFGAGGWRFYSGPDGSGVYTSPGNDKGTLTRAGSVGNWVFRF